MTRFQRLALMDHRRQTARSQAIPTCAQRINKARADEREKIAQAIEAMRPYGRPTAAIIDTLAAAARMARNGGRDE